MSKFRSFMYGTLAHFVLAITFFLLILEGLK